jgi:hypothetical protein
MLETKKKTFSGSKLLQRVRSYRLPRRGEDKQNPNPEVDQISSTAQAMHAVNIKAHIPYTLDVKGNCIQ